MASKFLRRQKWWVKFRHPRTGHLFRESLQTHDAVRAELMRARIEVQLQLLEPKFLNVELPQSLASLLDCPAVAGSETPMLEAPLPQPTKAGPAQESPTEKPRTTVDEAVAAYLRFVRSENASAHVSNKVSIFRRFLGDKRIEAMGGPARVKNCARKASSTEGAIVKPFFTGTYLDEITPALVQEFIEGLGVGRDTMRHYRQCFHHWFSFCLKFDLYHPTNWHRPNPMSGLSSYVTRNRQIDFLTQDQIQAQLSALHEHPTIRMAVAVMIYAGLRLSETLWLTRDSIAPDFSFLSVRNRADKDAGVDSSLKTGERTVTILPTLRRELELYVNRTEGTWLFPKSGGGRWRADTFGAKLRTLNEKPQLPWTCLAFRHTFATQRAAEGWPLFRIAKEMGNSVAVVEKYYAGFIRPVQLQDGSR
ncbi:tyrosine-type recombinase/integrase [Verrucomicrobium sp. BvORR034]|uniref:tyrosine-type recombinase/integrase n=1 Tax=Verrucomicrobium sp. BvORR034 TaxID=1396418 RepID=UPI0006785C87|nr:tyrosine-type recombinase/integrase [Verrucomicrobium sp. BvORR034]